VSEGGNEIRKWVFDCIQTEIIHAVGQPQSAGADQVICDSRVVLIVPAQVPERAVVKLPIGLLAVRSDSVLDTPGIAVEMFVEAHPGEEVKIVGITIDQHLLGLYAVVQAPEHMHIIRIGVIEGDVLNVSHPVLMQRLT
jgi:hypothetical protein